MKVKNSIVVLSLLEIAIYIVYNILQDMYKELSLKVVTEQSEIINEWLKIIYDCGKILQYAILINFGIILFLIIIYILIPKKMAK